MKEELYEVYQCDADGGTYQLTLHGTGRTPVTIRTDNPDVVLDLVMEHVHFYYKKIVQEKIKALRPNPLYIGFIDDFCTPFGKIEFRSRKGTGTIFEIIVDGEREYTSAFYHTALVDYVKELYTLINLNVSAQIRHLVEWL